MGKCRGMHKVLQHSILVGNVTQIYEFKLTNVNVNDQFLLHLHNMGDITSIQYIVMYGVPTISWKLLGRFSWTILNFAPLKVHFNPWPTFIGMCYIDLVTLSLTSYASSFEKWIVLNCKPNIAHNHFSITCEIPNTSWGILNSSFPSEN